MAGAIVSVHKQTVKRADYLADSGETCVGLTGGTRAEKAYILEL